MSASKSHPNTPARVFGSRVRERRLRLDWSQGELAERLQIHRTTLNKIEAGSVRGDVALSQLFHFAHVLGVSPLYLITPRESDEQVLVVGGERNGVTMSAAEVRAWLRGLPLPGTDPIDWLISLPPDEQRTVLRRAIEAPMRDDFERALRSDETSLAVKTLAWFLDLPTDQRGGALKRLQLRKEEGDGD